MKATDPSNWDGRDPYKLFPAVEEHDIDAAIARDATRPQKEVDAELQARGFDLTKLSENASNALKKALSKE